MLRWGAVPATARDGEGFVIFLGQEHVFTAFHTQSEATYVFSFRGIANDLLSQATSWKKRMDSKWVCLKMGYPPQKIAI